MFRALRWAFYNGPYYPRTGSAQTSVTTTYDDGTTVTRSRSAGTNRYVVGDQVYEGFGRDVPLEVQQALGIREIQIGDLSLQVNLARQHDPAFLITGVSAPARAKALGQIAGVDAVDLAIKDAGKDIFDAQREQAQVERQIAELEEAEAQYEHLPRLAERIEHLRKLAVEIEAAQERRAALVEIQSRLAAIHADEQAARGKLRRIGDVESAASLLDEAAQGLSRGAELAAIRGRLALATEGIAAAHGALRRLSRADEAAALIRDADEARGRLVALRGIQSKLANLDADEAQTVALLDRLSDAEYAGALIREAEISWVRAVKLTDIWQQLVTLGLKRVQEEQRLRQIERVTSIAPVLIEVGDALERHTALAKVQDRLGVLALHARRAESAITNAQADLEQATKNYADELYELGRCPTCGETVKDREHGHVLEVLVG